MDILFHTMDSGFDEVDDISKIIENQQFFSLAGPPIASQRNLQLLARLGDEV